MPGLYPSDDESESKIIESVKTEGCRRSLLQDRPRSRPFQHTCKALARSPGLAAYARYSAPVRPCNILFLSSCYFIAAFCPTWTCFFGADVRAGQGDKGAGTTSKGSLYSSRWLTGLPPDGYIACALDCNGFQETHVSRRCMTRVGASPYRTRGWRRRESNPHSGDATAVCSRYTTSPRTI